MKPHQQYLSLAFTCLWSLSSYSFFSSAATAQARRSFTQDSTALPEKKQRPSNKLAQFRDQLRSLSNQARKSQGLSELATPSKLDQAAQHYADVLAQKNCPLVHNCGGFELSERVKNAGIESVFRAENMIKVPKQHLEPGKTAHEELFRSWPHRRNTMLPEWTETGVGVSEGPNDYYFVQIFNQPQGPISLPSRLDEKLPITSPTPRQDFERYLKTLPVQDAISLIEGKVSRDFALFLGSNFVKESNSPTPPQITSHLSKLADQTGKRAGLIYVIATGPQLHLYLLAPELNGTQPKAVYKTLPIPRRQVLGTAQQFRRRVTNPSHATDYLPYAVRLNQWMIQPLQPAIDQLQLDTLLFTLDDGLRSTPMAALHDGSRFLIERYSVALIPSFGLTDPSDFKVEQQRLLAMGITESRSGLSQLPAVETEVKQIAKEFSQETQVTLNQTSTIDQLESLSRDQKYGIIHLATHAQFQPRRVEDSYIQFWDQKLTLNQLGLLGRELNWDAAPTVELLVLSACTTALGDRSVELGLAGSAVLAGVKSTVASLWNVNDISSTAFMIEFYRQLPKASIKSEAIRQTQIAMLRQTLKLEDGNIILPNQTSVPLEGQSLEGISLPFSHPYYWAGHTVIGNWN